MNQHPFTYRLIRSNRKTLAIQVSSCGQVTVRAPRTMSQETIHSFLTEKESWVLKHLSRAQSAPIPVTPPPISDFRRRNYMESARRIITRKAAFYASEMGVTYGRITIREQKTRWGSCSSNGNLNFNWRLIFAPEDVIDYVVVHELAHRKQMNHSPAFYRVVASVLPDYREPQEWLRTNGMTLWQKP
nr:SprT family zinc-dependent metalloprotease [uncultured Blautia sp.]